MAAATIPVGFEVAGDRRQLEEDFLELLIASERVGNLVDVIKDTSSFYRCQCNQEAAVCCRIIAYIPPAAVIVQPLTRTERLGLMVADASRRCVSLPRLCSPVRHLLWRWNTSISLAATWVVFACIWMLLLLPS